MVRKLERAMRAEQFLETSARRFPDKVALIVGENRFTYQDLNAMANRLAHGLRRGGVERGERVILFLDNSAEAVISIFAVLKIGAVFSMVNPSAKTDKLAYILNNCRARAVVTQSRLLKTTAAAVDQAPSVILTIAAGMSGKPTVRGGIALQDVLESAPSETPGDNGIDVDLAMVTYTSGSTGAPKGVMMNHVNICTAATSITTYLENTCDDIVLSVLPLSFGYGLYQVLAGFLVGATIILEHSFAFPYAVLQKMQRERVTGFAIVPTIAAVLLQMKELTPGCFPHLRYITNAAAALPIAHIKRMQMLLPTTRIFSMYGQTECTRISYLPPEDLQKRIASVGKAIPNTEVSIVNEKGEPVSPGEVGELVVRGGHVMQGYWENEEATRHALRPGRQPWERVLYTGDLFRMDEEGYLYFVARKDDIIKTRGQKVSPKEVENVLYALAGVRESAVVGVPDPILGMAIRAVIVPTEEGVLTERDVLTHCARTLEDFMVPKCVEFRSELPKTDSGKIHRTQIQAEVIAGVRSL
jgi:amino acid adenylation domain-containing protein